MLHYFFDIEERNENDYIVSDSKLDTSFYICFPDTISAHKWFSARIALDALYLRNAIERLNQNAEEAVTFQEGLLPRLEGRHDIERINKLASLWVLEIQITHADPQFWCRTSYQKYLCEYEDSCSGELVSDVLWWKRQYQLFLIKKVESEKEPVKKMI